MDNIIPFDHIPRFGWRPATWPRFNRPMDTTRHSTAAPPEAPRRYYTPTSPAADRTVTAAAVAADVHGPAAWTGTLRAGPPDAAVLPDGVRTGIISHNILTCTAASGGIGLSLTAALLARALSGRDLTCALVDLDLIGGGLDILLGIEQNPGTRFDSLDAPLGEVDGDALNQELPVWDSVRVLSHNPWNGPTPPWWSVQAAIRALSDTNGIVVVDAGRGTGLADIPELETSPRLIAVELSVLGLARAKTHLRQARDRHAAADVILVGMQPRGIGRQASGPVGVDEAEDYLGQSFDACMHADPKLCSDILSGLGAQNVARRNRLAVDALAERVNAMLERG